MIPAYTERAAASLPPNVCWDLMNWASIGIGSLLICTAGHHMVPPRWLRLMLSFASRQSTLNGRLMTLDTALYSSEPLKYHSPSDKRCKRRSSSLKSDNMNSASDESEGSHLMGAKIKQVIKCSCVFAGWFWRWCLWQMLSFSPKRERTVFPFFHRLSITTSMPLPPVSGVSLLMALSSVSFLKPDLATLVHSGQELSLHLPKWCVSMYRAKDHLFFLTKH